MNNGLSMSYYIRSVGFIITTAIIAYPFISFILHKFISNKWINRVSFILILLGGVIIFTGKFNDPVSVKLIVSLFFSYLLFHLITDQLYRISKELQIILVIFGSPNSLQKNSRTEVLILYLDIMMICRKHLLSFPAY